MPNVILTGSPGGTVIVTKSKNFNIKSLVRTKPNNFISIIEYDITAKQKRKIKKRELCFSKMFVFSIGNEMILINWPFTVTKLVLII